MGVFFLAVIVAMNLSLTSPAFQDEKPIRSRYAGSAGVSPPLNWRTPPPDTKSFALIVHDPDAPSGDWIHWVVFNTPGDATGFPENVPIKGRLRDGSMQGDNDSGKSGYSGPTPPSGTHHYIFELYALDTMLPLPPGSSARSLQMVMRGHILAQTQLVGLYSAGG